MITLSLVFVAVAAKAQQEAMISGKILSTEKEIVDFATVYLKGTNYGGTTNEEGIYHLKAPAGNYTLVVSAIGYTTVEKAVRLTAGERTKQNLTIKPQVEELDEVVIVSNGISRLKRSAFNAIAVDTKELQNSTKSLSDALSKAPGMKLRESGGVGSDMQLMLDGFSGKHVKVFIDGVPQEGVGNSFALNNIPVNFAERIEVYKGVVPVGFGTDAIGGVVNIVTNKKRRNWFLDASYSYGSFNTHKSYVNFGQTLDNGFTYEINAFQNYSDNDYYVDAPVKDFETGRLDTDKKERVKRFNDTYHNEAVIGKVGFVNRNWADRLLLGFTYSNMYQEIQTGVRQNTVYGDKHRKGHSLMPSLEYNKRDLLTKGLDLVFTANYNKNMTTNIDTSAYEYNWRGEKNLMNSRGEQSYQHTRSDNNNWNGTVTVNYRLGHAHVFTFNNVLTAFRRSNTSLLTNEELTDAIDKQTRKNIAGLSYRLMPSEHWNLSVFGKHYNQYVAGPMATDNTSSEYVRTSRSVSSVGYGAAGTYFILPGLQAKLSYEKAYRLPTIEEMFGNEDLEMGDIGIKPEKSDNVNLNVSYNKTLGKHGLYVEGGLIYRNTNDYIQRNITDLSGGKQAASYINYGKVLTKGYNLSARYSFSNWLSVGGNYTQMNVRDNQKTAIGSGAENIAYKERMPNLPYRFADSDITLYWRNFWKKGNTLIFTYDNQYLHSFTYYSSIIGSNKGEYVVPNQFSHNLTLSYSLQNGRYNISFECRNFTDEKLYDNFSLQKAGRAFYGKFRVYLGR
ncbi:TonB-dependent receptor [Parabacteroides faecis]|uniref:TonB-dependent receptor n=1 Tax=Parabacteroides TaxID=375288 RepID=UPI000EFED0BF|nr:TonB-dependent receptor [Parabacteroides faecis]RHS00407.1 TonB-dependent receptor [Parabacteroides sp. AF14-59]